MKPTQSEVTEALLSMSAESMGDLIHGFVLGRSVTAHAALQDLVRACAPGVSLGNQNNAVRVVAAASLFIDALRVAVEDNPEYQTEAKDDSHPTESLDFARRGRPAIHGDFL